MVMGEHAEMGGAGRIAQTRTGSLETTGRRVLCLHEEGGLEGKVCTMGQGILGKAGTGGRGEEEEGEEKKEGEEGEEGGEAQRLCCC